LLTSNIFATWSWLCGLFARVSLNALSAAPSRMKSIVFVLAFIVESAQNRTYHTCSFSVIVA
jgi:hypothetical protein